WLRRPRTAGRAAGHRAGPRLPARAQHHRHRGQPAGLAVMIVLRATQAAAVVAFAGMPAGPTANDQVAWGAHGAVVSAEPHATRIGLEVLRAGGNAVDAAAAVFLALAVTHPQAGNLGGGGFFLIRMADGTCTAIDCRETAPAAAHRDLYLRADGSVDAEKSLVGAT